MDSTANSTSFANLQGFFPPFTSQLNGGAYAQQPAHVRVRQGGRGDPDLAAELEELGDGRPTDAIIPTMMKSLMQGANFTATVSKANTELQNVLNTGKSS